MESDQKTSALPWKTVQTPPPQKDKLTELTKYF